MASSNGCWKNQSSTLLKYCIGSDRYREINEDHFREALEGLSSERVTQVFDLTHFHGLMAELVRKTGFRESRSQQILNVLQRPLILRRAFNRHLLSELVHFAGAVNQANKEIRPIVLKGISFWHGVYGSELERQTRDLDLLIETNDQLNVVCDVAESLGYYNLGFMDGPEDYRYYIESGDVYSLPPFRIRRAVDLDDHEIFALRNDGNNGVSNLAIEEYEPGAFAMSIDIELHKAVFTLTDGSFAETNQEFYTPCPYSSALREMSIAANLAYTATKFSFDAQIKIDDNEKSMKCLKLAADFARLLARASQEDIDTSVEIAKRWGCLSHFVTVLKELLPLVPEKEIVKLNDFSLDFNLIDAVVDHSLNFLGS